MRWNFSCALLAFALLPSAAHSQQAAGQVIWVSGEVASIRADKVIRPLAKGDVVHPGEIISTGPDSHVQILMTDQGLIAVRPDSSLRLTTYTYEGRNDGTERSIADLIKGGVRSITGAIGGMKKENQLLRGNNVLVGIRGTDHETFVQPDAGVYNRVTTGGTYLQSGHGRVDLDPGQVAFASFDAAPSLMARTPEFMHVTQTALPAGAPFNEGVVAHGRHTIPEHVALPSMPAQNWGGGNGHQYGRGEAGPGVGKGIPGGGHGKGRRP